MLFRFALQTNSQQVRAVFEAFSAALNQAQAAAQDASLDLPPVPGWAQEIKMARGQASADSAVEVVAPPKPRIDPALRAQAMEHVQPLLNKLEQELAEGHGKASAGAANALRQGLRDHAGVLPERFEHQVQVALAAASELEGWQRWRADQLRAELVAKAEALFKPAPPAAEGEPPPAREPVYGGRKMQEALRELREQWKQTDQGGLPNHGLWKRFDHACNRAYKVVEAWHDKARAEGTQHREARLALIAELQAWAQAHAQGPEWKGVARQLSQFSERWREAGHVSEKIYAELQPLWKAAFQAAHAPWDAAQKGAIAQRQELIAQAQALSQKPGLPLDQIKALQQRWQALSHAMALDRRTEQKLWDAFRAPIDALFERKSQERAQMTAALSAHDQRVMEASKALEAACQAGDAAAIRAATQALQQATLAGGAAPSAPSTPVIASEPASEPSPQPAALEASSGEGTEPSAVPAPAAAPTPVAPRKVVAVRGDDRPGMKKAEPAPATKGPRKGFEARQDRGGRSDRSERGSPRDAAASARGPRLGDAAFRAMRHAQDMAEQTLRKLSAQAHGEVLTQVLSAWKDRSAEQLPAARELGGKLGPAQRQAWASAMSQPPAGSADEPLLRLEIASDVPTPAAHLEARRAMQLKLLTQRHQATPNQTWVSDVEKVLASAHAEDSARRLQSVLKVFLR